MFGCQLNLRVDVNFDDGASGVILDFFGIAIAFDGWLQRHFGVAIALGLGFRVGNGLVWVSDGVDDIYMGHAVRVVWHGVLLDFKRITLCFDVSEADDVTILVRMRHLVRRKVFAVLCQCQS